MCHFFEKKYPNFLKTILGWLETSGFAWTFRRLGSPISCVARWQSSKSEGCVSIKRRGHQYRVVAWWLWYVSPLREGFVSCVSWSDSWLSNEAYMFRRDWREKPSRKLHVGLGRKRPVVTNIVWVARALPISCVGWPGETASWHTDNCPHRTSILII